MPAETPNFDDLVERDLKEYLRKAHPDMAETAIQAAWLELKAKVDEISEQFKNQDDN